MSLAGYRLINDKGDIPDDNAKIGAKQIAHKGKLVIIVYFDEQAKATL